MFGFEFFLTTDNQILLNESAPRPHNSGHYTIEGCVTSQFENHVRAVCGLPLGPSDLVKPVAVMINILGKRKGVAKVEEFDPVMYSRSAHLHVYGKEESKLGRKMGHITVLGNDIESALERAKNMESQIIL